MFHKALKNVRRVRDVLSHRRSINEISKKGGKFKGYVQKLKKVLRS